MLQFSTLVSMIFNTFEKMQFIYLNIYFSLHLVWFMAIIPFSLVEATLPLIVDIKPVVDVSKM